MKIINYIDIQIDKGSITLCKRFWVDYKERDGVLEKLKALPGVQIAGFGIDHLMTPLEILADVGAELEGDFSID